MSAVGLDRTDHPDLLSFFSRQEGSTEFVMEDAMAAGPLTA